MKEGGWEPLAARVQGLSTHLLGGARLAELSRLDDFGSLARALADAGATTGLAPDPAEVETLARRVVAEHLKTAWRWAGERQPLLLPFLEEEDRRSVRALLRGAAAGAPPPSRIAGLVPTPALPLRALEELAKQGDTAAVGALLRAWDHPFGAAVTPGSSRDLLATECAVDRLWAARATAALSHGPHVLRAAVRTMIDLANAGTILTLSAQASDVSDASLLLDGGRSMLPEQFAAIRERRRRRPVDVNTVLVRALRPGPIAGAVREAVDGGVPLEDSALRALIAWARTEARREPTGPAPVLGFILRLRAQLHDVQLLAWRVALGAPRIAPQQFLAAA